MNSEKYYLIGTDSLCHQIPRIIDWNKVIREDFINKELCHKLDDVSIVYVEKVDSGLIYPDVLDTNAFMLSELAYSVLKIYERSTVVKQVCLLEEGTRTINKYYLPILKEADCLSEESIFIRGRQIDKGILIKEQLPDLAIFRLKGDIDGRNVVVRLDFAESLLKRGAKAVALKELKVKGGR